MPLGITTVAGHGPIPFGGMGGYGSIRRRERQRFQGFAGSSDLVTIAQQALVRYQNAIDTANQRCESQSGWTQTAFNWITGNTSTQSICNAAAQMQINYDNYAAKIQDPNTSDDQIAEIIGFINKEIDIRDLLDLARSTDAISVMGKALLDAPGTAVGMVGSGISRVGAGILENIPWWGWAIGAVFVATQLGWEPLKYKPLRKG